MTVVRGMKFADIWVDMNRTAHFNILGMPGDVYSVYGSTNLLNWQFLSVVSNLTGVVPFVDPGATNFSRRFYRAVAP